MKKKLIALILCICLISCTCIQPAYAMGAEGIIVGGGAAAAGVTLTMPQVALLVAAGFGLVYATQHAEEIYQGLNTALTNAANNVNNGMEQLTTWTEHAAKGSIALASAPSWIMDTIKEWVVNCYESLNAPVYSQAIAYYAPNEPILSCDFWNNNASIQFPVSTVVLRAGDVTLSSNGSYYNVNAIMLAVASTYFEGASSKTIDSVVYYYKNYSTGLSIRTDTTLAGNNKLAYDSVNLLPSMKTINANYRGTDQQERTIKAWLDGYFGVPAGSVCPDFTVGGIGGAIDDYGIDDIKVPDLDIGGSKLLVPGLPGTESIDDILGDILTRLKQQELTWEDYMEDVAVGNPSITIEGKDYVIDDTGVTDIPVEDVVPDNPPADGVEVPEGLEPFTMSLTDFFPFCIPFDIADFVNVLCAEPEAPRFDWTFTWYGGDTDTLTIDLSPFDQVAQLLRNMELLLFCIGLALITRNQIRG